MPDCKMCGVRIHWDKGVPYDGSGKDHRERCAGMIPDSRLKVRDQNHEKRVHEFLSSQRRR